MTLARLIARKLTPEEHNTRIKQVKEWFSPLEGLERIILFGSAATQEMSEASDIDLVLIFDTDQNARLASKKAPLKKGNPALPVDLICVSVRTFNEKSQVGGVLFVARLEGKIIFERKP